MNLIQKLHLIHRLRLMNDVTANEAATLLEEIVRILGEYPEWSADTLDDINTVLHNANLNHEDFMWTATAHNDNHEEIEVEPFFATSKEHALAVLKELHPECRFSGLRNSDEE